MLLPIIPASRGDITSSLCVHVQLGPWLMGCNRHTTAAPPELQFPIKAGVCGQSESRVSVPLHRGTVEVKSGRSELALLKVAVAPTIVIWWRL